MTIIKNHFEVFLVTSKKHGNGKSWVIFNKDQFTHICQLNVSCGQDSMSGIVPTVASKRYWSSMPFQNLVRLSQIKKKTRLIMPM
jgi:hypothetical protein